MAADFWTKIDNNITSKPEVVFIAAKTGMPARYVAGCLIGLWCWVNQYGKPCSEQPGYGEVAPCNMASLIHQCGETEEFWRLVEKHTGWLVIGTDSILVPGYEDRFGDLQKKREHDAERKRNQRSREKSPAAAPASVPQTVQAVEVEPSAAPAAIDDQQPWQPSGNSQFDTLTEEMLANTFQMLRWAIQVAQRERGKAHPLCEHEEMHYVRVLAAARQSRSNKRIRSPLALFKALVGKSKNKPMIESDHMTWAERELRKIRHEIRNKPDSIKKLPRDEQLTLQFLDNLPARK